MKKQKRYLGLLAIVLSAGFADNVYSDWTTDPIPEGEELPPFTKLEFKETDFKNTGYRFYPDTWEVLDLNGTWKLKKLAGTENNPADDEGTTSGFWKKDFDDSTWLDQPVPLNWDCDWEKSEKNGYPKEKYALGGGSKDFSGVGWYRKEFTIPESFKNQRVRILFDAVDYETALWVNGKEAGKHVGGRTPFEFDVTDYVIAGEKNIIAIRVYDHSLRYSYGDNTHHRTGGIWQPVKIISSPTVYAKRTLVTPRINESKVEVDCLFVNASKNAANMELKALLKPLAEANAVVLGTGKYEIKHGEQEIKFDVKMNNPVFWEPDNPYLYSLLLKSGDTELGKVRFGYRQFEVKGKYFCLNGKRKYLFGAQGENIFDRVPDIECFDEGKVMSKVLLSMKKCGIEIIRNNNILRPPKYYQLCDELGMMVYDEWETEHPGYYNDRSPKELAAPELYHPKALNTEQYFQEIKEWIYGHYNYPSVVMLSFGNELFNAYAEPKYGVGFHDALDRLYDYVKSIDKSDRPICNSSGRGGDNIRNKDKTDVIDIHQYIGTCKQSWTKYSAMLEELVKEARKAYGHDKPIIVWELSGLAAHYHFDLAKKIREELDWSKKGDVRQAYVDFAQKKDGATWERLGIATCGLKKHYTTYKSHEYVCAETAKNLIEEFRRVGDIVQGMAPNDRGYMRILRDGKSVPKYYKYMSQYLKPLSEREFCTTPLSDVYKQVYRQKFICANVFDKNMFAPGELKVKIYAINDLDENRDGWKAKVRITDSSSKVLAETDKNIGAIKEISRTIFDYSYDIPASLKTGTYYLELKLFEKDEEISWNKYNFYVMSRTDLLKEIKTDKKACLYSGAEDFFNKEMNTKKILESLNTNFSVISNFNDLKNYQILIVGAGAIDGKIANSGETIRNWVEAGGRLLCLEQVWASYVPFLSEMKYFSGDTRSSIDIVQGDHPAFAGLTQDNFYDWNGLDKDLFKTTLAPLNASVLASGGAGYGETDLYSIKPVVADVKLGKGEMLFSQVLSIQRYGKDCAATKYIQNLLNYMLKSEISKYARTIEGEKIERVDAKNCLFVDLRAHANREFKDEISGDELGGWVDQGTKDFRNFPVGKNEFLGVPFDIIDPAKNNDKSCIVLKGIQRPYFPEQSADIPIKMKVNCIYFLHTCAWTTRKQIHAEYVVNYADETKEIIKVKEGENIADWDSGGANLPLAKVAWSGRTLSGDGVSAFLFKWHNPNPKKEVKSVDFISKEKGVPVLLGITCLKRDVLEDEN